MIQEQVIHTIDEIQGMLAKQLVKQVLAEGGAGSGHWGHKGRSGRRGGSVAGGGTKFRPAHFWKATMTEKEANEWAKGSAIKEPTYHGTPRSNIENIKKDGLMLGKGVFGPGVYTTNDIKEAGSYGVMLKTRVNVKKVLTAKNMTDFRKKLDKVAADYLASPEWPGGYFVGDAALAVRLQNLGYDALKIPFDKKEWLVVLDPKNITVVE